MTEVSTPLRARLQSVVPWSPLMKTALAHHRGFLFALLTVILQPAAAHPSAAELRIRPSLQSSMLIGA